MLPQFDRTGGFVPLVLLGFVLCSMTLVWLSVYAGVVASAGDLLRRGRIRRVLDALTGIALIALGRRLAAERQ